MSRYFFIIIINHIKHIKALSLLCKNKGNQGALNIYYLLLSPCLFRMSVAEHQANTCGLGCSAPSVLSFTVLQTHMLQELHVVGLASPAVSIISQILPRLYQMESTYDYWNDQDQLVVSSKSVSSRASSLGNSQFFLSAYCLS